MGRLRRGGFLFAAILAASWWLASGQASAAGIVTGTSARTQFEGFRDGPTADTFVDFNTVPGGNPQITTQYAGVTFSSNVGTLGETPFGPFYVYRSSLVPGQIVGSPCDGCQDDGRVGYQIVFTTPQRRAGLNRNWNNQTVTRFYNQADQLLGEYAGNGFVGYIADGPIASTDWVKRIQIDTISPSNAREVGYSDDLFFGSAAPSGELFNTNLIVNGDAEAGAGPTVPGWTTTGAFGIVSYSTGGGFPTGGSPGPANRGSNFFAGGDNSAVSSASQTIDVSGGGPTIDAGGVAFLLEGFLGGYDGNDDVAALTVTFANAAHASLGTATIGPVTPADRGGITGLLLRSTAGTVPVGTREVQVTLQMTRNTGAYNDGYADNLSLALSAPLAISLGTGFNLVGNSLDSTLNVVPTFGNQDAPVSGVTPKIESVWKWNPAAGRWVFYSPQLTAAANAAYAAAHGFDLMSSIAPGEGYWINATSAFTLAQSGNSRTWSSADFAALGSGFNLIAETGAVTPSQFHVQVSTGSTAFSSLWAWDAVAAAWYFHSPILETAGGLPAVKSYANGHGFRHFQDFGRTLGAGTGFWVNRP